MKIYWVLEKITSKPSACSSIKAVSDLTGMKYSRLSYQFSRKCKDCFETDLWRIVIVELKRSSRC